MVRFAAAHGDPRRRTTLVSIAAAALLVVLKLGVGLLTGSLALISAGIESSGDVVAAIMTFFAVRLGRQPADGEHPYGHGRAENLAALGEAGILLAGGVVVAVEAVSRLLAGGGGPDTHWYVFLVVLIALAVDLTRTVVSLRTARRFGSPALRSNAFHFAGDMAGSVAVLVGLLLVRAGFHSADAIAALLIAAIILSTAVRLIVENANVLMDRTPSEAREEAELALVGLAPEIELVRLRVRQSAGRYFADVVAAVAPGAALVEGHHAADLIEEAIERVLPGSDVVVHIEPRRHGLDLRNRILAVALAEPLVKEIHDVTLYEQGGLFSVSVHLKFPATLDLGAAVTVAGRIESEIRALPEVSEIQTHLEPMERPLAAREADGSGLDGLREVRRIVLERTGSQPQQLTLLRTSAGLVVFLSLSLDAATSIVDAHQLASELEEEVREKVPRVADVVVHTEARPPG